MTDPFGDRLVTAPAPDQPERFFDRFVFNLHPSGTEPSLVFGAGVHPHRDVADGFLVATTATEQRNLRFSTLLSASRESTIGAFAWRVVEPMRVWGLTLADNPSGVGFDLLWTARTPAWSGTVDVGNETEAATSFAHLFQSGHYTGTLTIDGAITDVDGWWGQRDRSRGVRTMSGGQGLHLWVQAQLPTMSVGFLHVEDRQGGRLLLEGAVMHEDGRLDSVTGVRHDLRFDDGLDLQEGVLEVTTASGASYVLDCDAGARGGYLAGGGYGGHHGIQHGVDHVEHDRYPLDGSVSPRTLDSALVDRATVFECEGATGWGILEFAHSRSGSYTYTPSLR
jgi:hypothetical protein